MTKEIDEEAKRDRRIFKKRMEALGDKILREEREENERREKDELCRRSETNSNGSR